jgi:5-methylthioadenosine/S-adenosylhomocysteine deaminase
MYFFEDTIAEVAGKAGLRAYLGFGILDGKTPEYDATRLLPACEAFVTRWSGKDTIVPVVAPHSTYTCGPETLARSLEIAERHDVLLHTHCSETRTEIYEVEEQYGVRPLEQLKRHGLLSARMVLAHCGWLTKTEVGDLAAAKASAVHCPVSNFKIGSGAFAPLPEMLAAAVPVGLGTDGAASNNSLDMFDTMKFAALGHKQHRWDPTVMPAPTVLDMATVGGASCLQAQETIGSLEVGKRADLAVIDLHKPHLTPRHDLRSHLVYAARGSDVETTIVDGVPLMLDRQFLTLDYEETLEKAQHAAQELIS